MRKLVLLMAFGLSVGACGSADSRSSAPTSSQTIKPMVATTVASPVTVTSLPISTSTSEVRRPPAWAIQVFNGKRHVIATVDSDGGGVSSPSAGITGGDQTNPDWSPDGSQITFAMTDGLRDDLWVTGVDGTAPRKIFDCEDACDRIDDPAWSPDGDVIAVCMLTAEGDDHVAALVSFDVATGAATTLYTPDRKRNLLRRASMVPGRAFHRAGVG